MKVLVTGAAGFIGMHTALRLLARGDEVIGIDNLNDYYDVQLKRDRLKQIEPHAAFRFVHMDMADRPGMDRLFAEHHFKQVYGWDFLGLQGENEFAIGQVKPFSKLMRPALAANSKLVRLGIQDAEKEPDTVSVFVDVVQGCFNGAPGVHF